MLIETRKELERFARNVVSKSKANLTRKGKNASDKLHNSIKSDLKVHKQSFSLSFAMEDYGTFQDRGVKGVKSGKSLGSYDKSIKEFTYKQEKGIGTLDGMPPPSAFDRWNIRRGRSDRDDKGRFLSRKQLNFKTAVGVFYYGIKPSMFFTKPFESAFRNLPDELIEAFGLDVEKSIKFTDGKN